MSKRHSRLIEYFITVGIEFESVAPINDDSISNPIRSLRIISEKEIIPFEYECIKTTVTGKDASVTKKGMMMKNTKHYLCYSREGTDQLFTRIQYIKAKNMNSKEWNRVPGKIMSGKTEYCLCTKNDTSVPPIADICIITVDGKESCPDGYVKLPATINGLAICFRHLPMDALGLRYQTCILDRYPRIDYANSPLSNTVAVFCQPNGADIRAEASMPTFLSFVLTDSEGRKMYAITVTFYDALEAEDEASCIRSLQQIYTEGFKPVWPDTNNGKNKLYHSKSVCILSYYPFFLSFREVLKEIYRLANSPGRIPIERYIINLCEETPLPIPSSRTIQLLYAHKPITFRIPDEDELPLLDSNIKKIFCCLSLNNTLLLYKVLITQKYKILFTSSHISLITEICETLVSFLQPFEWQFTYVPVLPYSVFGILDAPVPVLVGMHSSRIKPDYYSDPEKEIIIVDLDNNSVHIPNNLELIDIPTNAYKQLKTDLKQYAKANKVALFDKNTIQFVDSAFNVQLMIDDDIDMLVHSDTFNPLACRASFYRFWIKLLGPSYQQFLQFPDEDDIDNINDIFDIDGFINSRPKNLRKFWRQFSQTQAFQKFIEDLTYESTEDRAVALKAFYKCCQYEYKEMDDLDINDRNYLHKKPKKLSSANISTSSLSDFSPKSSSFSGKNNMIDPFTEFLQERIPELQHYIVPQANEKKLDASYKYEVCGSFPTLNDKLLIKPRKCNLLNIVNNTNESKEATSPILVINDDVSIPNGGRIRSNTSNRSKKPAGRSVAKNQTPLDRAKFQLLQIYGTWFASHVAALDFKDIPGDEVQMVVNNTLEVLYRMTDLNTSRDICIIPDELIYKACLILCGKFGKKKAASKIFKDLKKNGITPSQKTYGAYTNAMASSGANMLLSAAGSTSSGTSTIHRRSFAPQIDGLGSGKIRSLSAAMNPANSRLHAPHKINTIAEDEERDGGIVNGAHSPYSEHEEEKIHIVLPPQKSSPFPAVKLSALKEDIEPKMNGNNVVDNIEEEVSPGPPPIMNVKSAPGQYLVGLSNSSSTPTPSPKIEFDPPPLAQHSADEEEDFKGKNGSTKIVREVWRDDSPTPSKSEEDEAKQLQPSDSQQLKPSSYSNTTTQPSLLSSQVSASMTGSMSVTPEPKDIKDINNINNKESEGRFAIIIDYSSLEMEAKHECKCGYKLSDAQIMVGWCGEFTVTSNNLRCIMCRQNTFSPRLHLRYNITKMSMKDGICSFEVVDKNIEYISPLQLRSKINFILQHRRLDFEDPETFRTSHEDEFWNMIWYFYNRQLDLSFLLGEGDSNSLEISPFGTHLNKKEKNNIKPKVLNPSSDDELFDKLLPIYKAATNNKLREAISEWLYNRSQTPSELRNKSIWNLSVFDSFHDLNIPNSYKTYDLFIKEFKNACRNIRPKIRDRAWDDPSLAIQLCFKHPRNSHQRLQNITEKLTGKPKRPHVPVPVPPKKN